MPKCSAALRQHGAHSSKRRRVQQACQATHLRAAVAENSALIRWPVAAVDADDDRSMRELLHHQRHHHSVSSPWGARVLLAGWEGGCTGTLDSSPRPPPRAHRTQAHAAPV